MSGHAIFFNEFELKEGVLRGKDMERKKKKPTSSRLFVTRQGIKIARAFNWRNFGSQLAKRMFGRRSPFSTSLPPLSRILIV